MVMRYTFFTKYSSIKTEELYTKYTKLLNEYGKGLFIKDDKNPEYVFSFGGDGTMLSALHEYMFKDDKIKFVGIKMGNLGFFTDYEVDEFKYLIQSIINNDYKENKYHVLKYVLKNNEEEEIGFAINEITLINPIHTQIIDVYIDNNKFETFRGTGLLICPPTGSTAYNKSLGGTILDPKVEAFQLTEIAALNNTIYKSINSSLVLNKNSVLTLITNDSNNIYVSVDGKEHQFNNIKQIEITLSDDFVNIISKKDTIFWKRVEKAFIK